MKALVVLLALGSSVALADEDTGDRMMDKKKTKKAKTAEEPAKPRTTQICVDQEIADRLAIKRKRRGAAETWPSRRREAFRVGQILRAQGGPQDDATYWRLFLL